MQSYDCIRLLGKKKAFGFYIENIVFCCLSSPPLRKSHTQAYRY